MTLAESWRRFGPRVGYPTRDEYFGPAADGTDLLGLIHLEYIREFDSPVWLRDLRANRVPFATHIQQGRGLSMDEVATVLRLGESWH